MNKKRKAMIVFLVLILCLFLVSCQLGSNSKALKLGLVIDVSGVDDKSFNQSAWEAIQRFAKENNLSDADYSYTHSMTEKEYIPNVTMYADQQMDLIIALGYYYIDPLLTVAPSYPDQKFLFVDGVVDLPNVASVTFASNEGSFLAGVIAGLKAKEEGYDAIGFLGGMDIPTVRKFEAGYEQGVRKVNPELKILVEYAKDFANPLYGKEIANKMYSKGAKIIFNVAGGTGTGLIDAAKERAKKGEDVWVIGVDKDQYEDGKYGNNKSVILTSIMKNVEKAVYDNLQAVKNNEFKPEIKIYSLKNNGVKLPEKNPNLKDEWIKEMEKYKQDIIEDKITVPIVPERIYKHN